MSAECYICILAGGSGTRLWPLSRSRRPKQLLSLLNEHSLLRNTFDRIRPLVPPEQVFILTEGSHADGIRAELPEVPPGNVLVEPTRRGTAGSLALPAEIIHRRSPGAVWASLHSDHLIRDDDAFRANLRAAFRAAEQLPHLFTLGIVPTFASTQLGYVGRAEELARVDQIPVYRVGEFVEKPPAPRAAEYVRSGEYYWNAGIFIWSAASIRGEFRRLLPDIAEPLEAVADRFGSVEFDAEYRRVYPSIPVETIDQGILERALQVAVMPALFDWVDIGSWKELHEAFAADTRANVVRGGEHLAVDTEGSLVLGGRRLIATLGVEDLVIVDTDDVLLVARRDRAPEVRKLVEHLEQQGRRDLL